ncbi:hypothetical protein PLEOSDRAFT_1097386 [Pleurotus ostreatus PC15]|uniref:Uncharacterized protein n=1 Tax=Pleurotus ostreatus (strain PC15) TaxID=1137138 RepID=A0A067NGU3_PLEO1|nr:hypothetical protein PLEOSDRAFT_1097386 [Pleurotus ostreatus PC15]
MASLFPSSPLALSPAHSPSHTAPARASYFPHSPSAPTMHQHKHVHTRRGSVSASDAYGKHAHINVDPNRSSSSILTIVRVPTQAINPFQNPAAGSIALQEPPRRHGHHHGHGRRSQDGSERMSFAFTSFNSSQAPSSSNSSDRGLPSPTSSPRLRPSSPTLSRQQKHHQPLKDKPRLTPDQLVDLARQSTDPNALPPSIATLQAQPHSYSPGGRNHSPSRSPYDSPSPTAKDQLTALSTAASQGTAPATFTPLPDEIYLPFIDRPAEVATLISNPPTVKLLALLAQTFPKKDDVPPPSDATSDYLPLDPRDWTYAQLQHFLSTSTRQTYPDFLFAVLVRRCVMCHSELIWERLKGALGVPPELDVDVDMEWIGYFLGKRDGEGEDEGLVMRGRRKRRLTSGSSALDTSGSPDPADGDEEVEEDGGRKAFGYWEDWDAVMDSPVWARRGSLSSRGGHPEDSPTLSHHNLSASLTSLPSAGVTIEPLLLPDPASLEQATPNAVSPAATVNNMTGSTDGLQDIGEEEEPEEDNSTPASTTDTDTNDNASTTEPNLSDSISSLSSSTQLPVKNPYAEELEKDPELVMPARIQGLKISTAPVPQDPTASPLLSAVSGLSASPSLNSGMPLPSTIPGQTSVYNAYNAMNASAGSLSLAHGRSASFSSLPSMNSAGFFASQFTTPAAATPTAHHSTVSYSHSASNSLSSSFAGAGGLVGVQRSNSGSSLYKMRNVASGGVVGKGVSAYLASAGRGGVAAGMGIGVGMPIGGVPSSRRSSHGSIGSIGGMSVGGVSDVGDRAPGNPLFPSNFARLAGGPTLNANNPALRGSPSGGKFSLHHVKPRSRPPSRSSAYSYTSSASDAGSIAGTKNDPPAPPPPPSRRAAGVINSGAGVPLGIMPGGIIVGSKRH